MYVTSEEWRGVAAEELEKRHRPWPAGLRSYTILTAADGDVVRDYAQWTTQPGAERVYQPYRVTPDTGRTPGAIVVVRVDTDGPELSRAWVDAVFAALADDRHLPAGGLGAQFLISTDGTRVLNYAQWESVDAHRAAGEVIGHGPLWEKVRTMPGVRPQSVTRFHIHATRTS